MLDNILILVIFLLVLLSFFIVKKWKKRHFIKELYIGKAVSIVFYIITIAITIGLITMYFITLKENQYSWLYLLIVLILDLFMMAIYCLISTTCIYLKEDKLIRTNIFYSKKIEINKETTIIDKLDRKIIKSTNGSISINSRYLTGNINYLIYKIKNNE